MMEAAYARIAAAIRLGRGSRLIAVLVPPEIPLLPAAEKLQTHLLGRGVAVRPIRIDHHSNLLEAIHAAQPESSQAIIAYGLEALSRADRESFLRATSFARNRLQVAAVAVILVLGTETWSWIGMQLPDLARWVDGPFLVSDDGAGFILHAPRPRLGRPSIVPSSLFLDDLRNVDIQGPIDAWIERGGILEIGGPPGVGITHLATRIEERLTKLGRNTAATENLVVVEGTPMVGGTEMVDDPEVPFPKSFSALRLADWLELHKTQTVLISRPFRSSVDLHRMSHDGMTALLLGPSSKALARSPAGIQLYLPPVQVMKADGSEHTPGVDGMVHVLLEDSKRIGLDFASIIPTKHISTLAFCSGGLPGLLWKLAIEVVQRALRVGSAIVTQELVQGVIMDMAASRPPVTGDETARAVKDDILDFDLEARGAVLFYVIDGQLRTLRHPLSVFAERAGTDTGKYAQKSRRRRRPVRRNGPS